METTNFLRQIHYGGLVAILFFMLLGCEQTDMAGMYPPIEETKSTDTLEEQSLTFLDVSSLPFEELSQEEINGLMFMREEEKLARDTYIQLYDLFGLQNFKNISKSEQAHMDAILYLLEKYNLEDPVDGNGIGIFHDGYLQQLFDDLLEMGQTDRIAALKAGALIEETDILDIQKELDHVVDNQDINFVYKNLIRGSKNHLKSFVGVLRFNGVEYEPILLDKETYLEIIGE